ncbi:DUF2142 domain-containing protein [Chlorobium sp.]|uniref:DUF2142 domain-containing protein n=1 Tax=Chlorobium sp. TaxID=1095 RepID=UPI0025B84F31|nr:DUF2142 domain-containing protein [Chlorobium sp.]
MILHKKLELYPGFYEWFIARRYTLLYDKLHYLWGFFIAPFVIVMVFFTPPFQVPDEFSHFAKTDQVSRGVFMPGMNKDSLVGNQTSAGVKKLIEIKGYNDIASNKEMKVDAITSNNVRPSGILWDHKTEFVKNSNTAPYFAAGYFVQAIGLLISKNTGLNVISSFYFSRYLVALVCIVFSFFAIKIYDYGKLMMFVILSFPMTLFEYASVSQDGILIASAALGIAIITNDDIREKSGKKYYLLRLSGLLLLSLAAFGKPPYVLIYVYFLFSVLFYRRSGNGLSVFVPGLVILGVFVLWCVAVAPYTRIPLITEANPAAQIVYIKNNPLVLVDVVLRNAINNVDALSMGMFGILGWLDTKLSSNSYVIMKLLVYVMTVAGVVVSVYKKRYYALMSILIALLSLFLISLALYISWTPVGQGSVEGVQGRYMIPVFLMITYLLREDWLKKHKNYSKAVVATVAFLMYAVGLSSLFSILQRYYI